MSLFFDIGQGAGLSGATGIRPFLPPLLAGALARADAGIDFGGTSWDFLESPIFLLGVFALAVLWYIAARSGPNRTLEMGAAVLGITLGALFFAGSLAEGGSAAWPGIVAGGACAALAWVSVGGLFERARRRLAASAPRGRRPGDEAEPAGGPDDLLVLYAEGIALLLAGVAVVFPPLCYLALIAFVVLLVRGGRDADRKYAGLRVLR
jgi:hypothetical protein